MSQVDEVSEIFTAAPWSWCGGQRSSHMATCTSKTVKPHSDIIYFNWARFCVVETSVFSRSTGSEAYMAPQFTAQLSLLLLSF